MCAETIGGGHFTELDIDRNDVAAAAHLLFFKENI